MADQIWGEHQAILQAILEEWYTAEEDIKLAEQVCSKVSFPSIKELRYAGRKVVEILVMASRNMDSATIESKLRDIRHDCHRARHDAIDAGSAKIASDITIMTSKLGYDAILRVYPQFGELHRKLNDLRERIADSRKNTVERDRIYSGIEQNHFPPLVSMFRELLASEPVIKALAKTERKRQAIVLAVGIIELAVLLALVLEHWRVVVLFLKQLVSGI